MNLNSYKGTKNAFSHFVEMALQNTMPWKTLAILLKDFAPTLDETREIINILLNKLETLNSELQDNQKELKKYEDKFQIVDVESDTIVNDIQDQNILQGSEAEAITITDDVMEVFKEESGNGIMSFDLNDTTEGSEESIEKSMEEFESVEKESNDEDPNSELLIDQKESSHVEEDNNEKEISAEQYSEKSAKSENLEKKVNNVSTKCSFPCHQCGNFYLTISKLQLHQRIVHENDLIMQVQVTEEPKNSTFTCDICEKSYPYGVSLKRHMEMIHERIIKFKCELCDYGNYEVTKVKLHLRQKHEINKDEIMHLVRRIRIKSQK